jgi:prepilin-type N-terminal cleavage/methylation domain-containing protein
MGRRETGFTLIELLIVVAIIGILAAIAVPNFMNAQIRAKVSRSMADQRTLENAILQYTVDYNDNPPHSHEANQNWWLTTPVAYLASFLYDPFQEIPTAKELFGSELQFFKRQHHWVIIGHGPSTKYLYAQTVDWAPYDASNGLHSWGLILRYPPGRPKVPFALP